MKYSQVSLVLFISALSASAATVVDEIGDLTFQYQSGASEASSSATALGIQTSKNSYAYASLPNTYEIQDGESITVSFDLTMSDTITGSGNSFDIGFIDSNTPGTASNLGYDYSSQVDPADTANGLQFREGGDANLGKFNTLSGFGTTINSFTFELARTGTEAYELSLTSNLLNSTKTVGNDVIPLATTTFDRVYFAFRGNGWSEDFGGSTAVATVNNFSIDTTGSAVPEPSSFALLTGIGVLALVGGRRRRRA